MAGAEAPWFPVRTAACTRTDHRISGLTLRDFERELAKVAWFAHLGEPSPLLAQSICAAGRNPDDREVMVGLAVQHYVAQQIGLVPADLFAEIASYLPDGPWPDLLRWFGTQDDITLEDFAWQLVETPDGPDFVSTL